jgi:transposase InsO family protein
MTSRKKYEDEFKEQCPGSVFTENCRSMKANMTAEPVIDALKMAVRRRGKPESLLHHSDQGSQYTSDAF